MWDAAFGSQPGRHPLAAATTTRNRWWRAVALGGQGRYAAADTELAVILRQPAGGVLLSLAASTHGSHLRQLGGHAAARPWDARALAAATFGLARDGGEDPAAARCDAWLGLAADALGTGQTRVSRRLLTRCESSLDMAGWRCRLRWRWVCAETALRDGAVATARVHAHQGDLLARECPSVRHRVKSRLVQAAAQGPDGGAEIAAEVLGHSRLHGLLPLQWASAMLVRALTVPTGAHGIPPRHGLDAQLTSTADLLARRGGVLT